MITLKSGYNLEKKGLLKTSARFLFEKVLLKVDKSTLIKLFEYIVIPNENKRNKSNYYVCTGGSYGFQKEIVKKIWFEKTRLFDFEDLKVKGPLMYEEYLENLYGDYLKLPKEEDRISRHKIDKKEISNRMMDRIYNEL